MRGTEERIDFSAEINVSSRCLFSGRT